MNTAPFFPLSCGDLDLCAEGGKEALGGWSAHVVQASGRESKLFCLVCLSLTPQPGWFFPHSSKTTPQIKLSPLLKCFVDPIGVLNRRGVQTQAEAASTDQMRCLQNEMLI